MQPNLALVYNSSGGNGTMGPGWSLTGLGAIIRCDRTVAQDGAAAPVGLLTSDGYCLNGNRLRLISGTYGVAGSTYQTELADFSQITANGAAGNGPSYFIVKAKDGQTYEYGNSADSRVTPSTSIPTPYKWLVNKVSDRSGNFISVTYGTPVSTAVGVSVPVSLSYGNSSTSLYGISLSYQANTAVGTQTSELAGNQLVNPYLLATLEVTSGSAATTVRRYTFTYLPAVYNTTANRLVSVQECADHASSDCFPATQIGYQDGAPGLLAPQPTGIGATANVIAADVNGDGRDDLIFTTASGGNLIWQVELATPTGYSAPITVATVSGSATYTGGGVIVDDLDGDGKNELLAPTGSYWTVYHWNGTGFTPASTSVPVLSNASFASADVNGDGHPDIVWATNDTSSVSLYVDFNTTSGSTISFAAAPTLTQTIPGTLTTLTGNHSPAAGTVRHIDFDGDKRDDLILTQYTFTCNQTCSVLYSFVELLSRGAAPFILGPSINISSIDSVGPVPLAAHWNDDACTDLIAGNQVLVSDCNGNYVPPITLPATATLALDWDALAFVGSQWQLYRSLGNSVAPAVNTGAGIAGKAYAMDQDGDRLDDWVIADPNTGYSLKYGLHQRSNVTPDIATQFTDGLNLQTTVSYTTTAMSNYTAGTAVSSTESAVTAPLNVVAQTTTSDGIGGTYTQTFQYTGAVEDIQGRGFEGFQSVKVTDSRTDAPVVMSYFKTAFPYTGMTYQQDVFQHNGTTLISHTVNSPGMQTLDATANNQRYFPYVNTSNTQSYEVGGAKNGLLITTTATTNSYYSDNTGNLQSSSTTVTDNDAGSPYVNETWTTATSYTITPDTTNWCLGLPSTVQVVNSSTASGATPVTRTTNLTPDADPTKCRISAVITEPASSTFKVTKNLFFDTFGNVRQMDIIGKKSDGSTMATRTTKVDWGTTGQFPVKVTNALNQDTLMGYDFNRGVRTSVTDPNGLPTTWLLDSFGRPTRETRPDSTYTTIDHPACDPVGGCAGFPVLKMMQVSTNYTSGGTLINTRQQYSDMYGRQWADLYTGFDGNLVHNDTSYDARGRIVSQSMPYQTTPYYSMFGYDALGRRTSESHPTSSSNSTPVTTTTAYEGRTTRVTDPNLKVKATIAHVSGLMGRTQDHNNYYVELRYDAAGSLLSATDSAGTKLFYGPCASGTAACYSYGIKAFQTAMTDADLGPRSYSYDSLGDLTSWSDAKGQSFSATYDALSRMTSRTEPDLYSVWTWGSSAAAHEIGQLNAVSATNASQSYAES
jgi:YD repeat-containing protein